MRIAVAISIMLNRITVTVVIALWLDQSRYDVVRRNGEEVELDGEGQPYLDKWSKLCGCYHGKSGRAC